MIPKQKTSFCLTFSIYSPCLTMTEIKNLHITLYFCWYVRFILTEWFPIVPKSWILELLLCVTSFQDSRKDFLVALLNFPQNM